MRRLSLLTALALVLVACGGSGTPTGDGGDAPETTADTTGTTATTTTTVTDETTTGANGLPAGPSALRDMNAEAFPEPLVDPSQIISGGPPPDGIPPIDNPKFVSVEEADAWLADDEPVVAIEIDGDARAYPIQIMIWHEIVNDTVGGVPVAVTYCPLCNSAISYVREVRGVETTFGTSGRLFASALVMYDRATESLWTHFDGKAVVGVLTGEQLEPVPSPLLAWSEFKGSYPDGQVLDVERTGFNRPYGTNPYTGYDDPDTQPFMFRGDVDERAAAKQRVVGVEVGDAAKAWALDGLAQGEASATNASVGDQPIVILWEAGQSSALEGGSVTDGRDVGSVGVFDSTVDGEVLTFEADDDTFVDTQTGSTWEITGIATDGPLAGTQLERIPHLDTFWFAWSTYQPETELIEG